MNDFRLCMFLLCSLSSGFLWAFDISKVAEPPKSNAVFVGEVLQNGLPVQMKQFYSDLNPVEVLSYYKQRWSDNRNTQGNVPAAIEKKVAEWFVLSKVKGLYSVVVQVKEREGGGSEGFISVLKMKASKKIDPMIKNFPRLGGTTLLSGTESKDGNKHATTLMLKNDYSVGSNDAFYRAKMESEGWSLVQGKVRKGIATLLFNTKGKQCEMVISSDDKGDSIIIVNVVKGVFE